MAWTKNYETVEPKRDEVDQLSGPMVIEFGTAWCGYCRGAQSLIADAFAAHPNVRHLKVEDGSGRRLGRSFTVKLWPTLIFMKAGQEVARVVRPQSVKEISEAFAKIDVPQSEDQKT